MNSDGDPSQFEVRDADDALANINRSYILSPSRLPRGLFSLVSGFVAKSRSILIKTLAITTVGYGEIIPRSFLGRLIAVPLLMFGLILIALPSFVLGREFSVVWEGMGGTKVRLHVRLYDVNSQSKLSLGSRCFAYLLMLKNPPITTTSATKRKKWQ